MTVPPAASAVGTLPSSNSPVLPRGLGLAALCTGFIGALALGWYITERPDLLYLDASLSTPMAAAAALAGLALVLFVALSPELALVSLLSIMYLNLSDALVRTYGLPSVLQLLGIPILVSAWVHYGRGAVHRLLGQPLTWLLTAYVLVLLASGTWAERPDLAEFRFAESLKTLVLYTIVVLLVTTRHRARTAVWTLVAAGTFLGVLGLVHLVTGLDAEALGGMARSRRGQTYGSVFQLRLAGPLGDPNFFAQILLVLVPLGLHLAWMERERRNRGAAAICLAVILTALVLTYSRGGALALGFVLVSSFVAHGTNWRRIVGSGVALLLAALLLLPSGFTERLSTVSQFFSDEGISDMDSSFEERLLLVGTAWEMFVRNPAVGVGAGNYTARFGEYAEHLGSAAQDYTGPDAPRFAHSLYFEVAAETGLLGLGVLLAVLTAAFLSLGRARLRFRDSGDAFMASLARALQIALAGYLLSSLFLHGAFHDYLWLLFALAAAIGATAAGYPKREAHTAAERSHP